MKFCSILLCLIVIHISYVKTATPRSMSHIHKSCKKKNGVTDEEIRDAQKGLIKEDNMKVACFIRCVLRKTNFMKNNGSITPDKALATLPLGSSLRNRIEHEFGECSQIDDPNMCKKALKIYQCAYKKFSRKRFPDLF